jgi:hypothetical protein
MLGVSRQRVDQLAASDGFPEPVAQLAAGRIWRLDDVEKWAQGDGPVGELVSLRRANPLTILRVSLTYGKG